jgi:hypothetical protein
MTMWYYEIADKHGVLETSEAVYSTEFDAQMAGWERLKENPTRFDWQPTNPGKVEGGLHSVLVTGPTITTKHG